MASRSRPIALLIVCGVILIAALAAGTGALVSMMRTSILDDNERDLSNIALILAQQSADAFRAVDVVEQSVVEHIRSMGISSRRDFDARLSDPDTHLMLKDQIGALAHVDVVSLVSAQGKLVNYTRRWPAPAIDVTDREYFKVLTAAGAPSSFLSAPVRSHGSGTWTIYAVRRVNDAHGELVGFVVSALRLPYFENFFGSIALGEGSSISLARSDGVLLARYPRIEQAIGQPYTGVLDALKNADHATFRIVGRWDTGERLIAARRVPGFPLAISVGVDVATLLADWRGWARAFVGTAAVAACLIALIGFLIVRQLQRGYREQRLRLDTALNQMSQGLCLFDRHARLVLCNDRYRQMYGLSSDVVKPGSTLRQILDHRTETGSFRDDPERYCTSLMESLSGGTVQGMVVELPDGRVVRVTNRPTSGGGWVATHEDVTERHRAQRQAEQAHARLREVIDLMPAGLVFYDAQDRLVLWNRTYDEIFAETAAMRVPGVRFEDMLRGALAHGMYPAAAGREDEWLAGRLAMRESGKVDEQLMSDGRWLRIDNRRTADGGFIGIRVDITELKRREDELKVQNMRFDAALRQMSQGLVLFDRDRRLIVCNDRYVRMYGLPPELTVPGVTQERMMQHRIDAGLHTGPEADRYMRQRLAESMSGTAGNSVIELSDGRVIAVAHCPTDDGGWVSTHEDITERRRAEQERDRNRRFLDLVIENVPVSIVVRNATDRKYVLINRAGEELFGISRCEIVGRTVHDFLSKEHADLVSGYDQQLLSADPSAVLMVDEHEIDTPANGRRLVASRRIALRGEDGTPMYILGVVEDVTERKRADERIARLATYDALTDLPNRMLFRQRLDDALKWLRPADRIAVLYLDLDFFKHVNDSLGHPVGDELLKAVAQRLHACVKQGDTVARLGGDEFAIIQHGIAEPDDTTALTTCILEALRKPYDLDGHQLVADASIGIAIAPDDGHEPDQLLKNADLALYGAKADGRGTYRFFEPEMDARVKARRALEEDLRKALARGEFELHYQPLLDLRTNRIRTCEALIRWNHPQRGLIPPGEFIGLAEETGLIVPIGEWVLRQACAHAAEWPREISVAVNLSAVQFKLPSLSQLVVGALAAAQLEPRRLELEITESVLVQNSAAVSSTLRELHELGVRFAMDDFGTGYSSLGYLRNFPLDKIKIDRTFVSDLTDAETSASIVRAIVGLATSLNMTTAAEGVETEQQLAALRAAGCTEIQGFLFSRPLRLAQLRRLMTARPRRAASVA